MRLFLTTAAVTSVAVFVCLSCAPAANAPSAPRGAEQVADVKATPGAGAGGLRASEESGELHPDLYELGLFEPIFERVVRENPREQVTERPLALTADSTLVLAFGRRLVVTGKQARLVDRRENLRLTGHVEEPSGTGVGVLFVSEAKTFYAPVVDAPLIALELPFAESQQSYFFGGGRVYAIDPPSLGAESEDDGAQHCHAAQLATGQAEVCPVPAMRGICGTLDGRMVAFDRDGLAYFARQPGATFRKTSAVGVRGCEVHDTQLVTSSAAGEKVLAVDGEPTEIAALPASPPPAWYGAVDQQSRNLLGRLIDPVTVVMVSGSSLTSFERNGVQRLEKHLTLARANRGLPAGQFDGGCSMLDGPSSAPLYIKCYSEAALLLFRVDVATAEATLERAFPKSAEHGFLDITSGPAGTPIARGHCDGVSEEAVYCTRTKQGKYKEFDFFPRLRALGLTYEDASGTRGRIHRSVQSQVDTFFGDDGQIAIAVRKGEDIIVLAADGRELTVAVAELPRRLRALSTFSSSEEATLWLGANGVYGMVPRIERRVTRRPPVVRPAFAFTVPFRGAPTVTEFAGATAMRFGHALRVAEDGRGLLETTDAGLTFHPVDPIPGVIDGRDFFAHEQSAWCSDAACQLGPWLRHAPRAPSP